MASSTAAALGMVARMRPAGHTLRDLSIAKLRLTLKI